MAKLQHPTTKFDKQKTYLIKKSMKLIRYEDILSAARRGGKLFAEGKYLLTPLAKEALKRHNVEILSGGSSMRKIIIAGNWKMNMSNDNALKLSKAVAAGLGDISSRGRIAVMCPPFTALTSVAPSLSGAKGLYLGAQNIFYEDKGAYTGEISADMLISCGCTFCIIGHSERRKYFGETDETVNKKVKKSLEKSLTPIICVGETLEERESSRAFNVVKKQVMGALNGMSKEDIAKVVIAYEPVWAIGTGKTASPEQAQSMHAYIREQLAGLSDASVSQAVPILYGGSMNPANVKALIECPDIDGGLIGGASLKAEDFLKLVHFDD